MPTSNPRITFTVSDDMMSRIDEYRFDNRIKNQTQAIVTLLNRGLAEVIETTTQPFIVTEEEQRYIIAYRNADDRARSDAMRTLKEHPKVQDKKQV